MGTLTALAGLDLPRALSQDKDSTQQSRHVRPLHLEFLHKCRSRILQLITSLRSNNFLPIAQVSILDDCSYLASI